jgi:hypothetical protein
MKINLTLPFTGIQLKKSINKRQALQQVFCVLEDAGLSGKSKPNIATMKDKDVDALFIKMKTLANS